MSDKRDFYQNEDLNQGPSAVTRNNSSLTSLFFYFQLIIIFIFFGFFPKEMQLKFFLYLCNLILTN